LIRQPTAEEVIVMSLNRSRLTISRTGWIAYAMVEVALFAAANITAQNSSHPGAVSNVFFAMFGIGLVLAVLIGAASRVRRSGTGH